MVSATLDSQTLEAVGVLARAVEQVRVPGVVEFRLLANALKRTLDTRSEDELNDAARVFKSLEPEFRARIMERAESEAHALARRADAVTLDAPLAPPLVIPPLAAPGRPAMRTSRSIGSSFLAALNGVKAAPGGRAESRGAAKDRLKAAVDSQRALPEQGPDVGYDTGLHSGGPFLRSS